MDLIKEKEIFNREKEEFNKQKEKLRQEIDIYTM